MDKQGNISLKYKLGYSDGEIISNLYSRDNENSDEYANKLIY